MRPRIAIVGLVRGPDGTTGTWVAAQDATDPTALTYTTVQGDLSQAEDWWLHAHVAWPDWQGRGDAVRMTVEP